MEQQPALASLRVSKSRFAPAVGGGERRKVTTPLAVQETLTNEEAKEESEPPAESEITRHGEQLEPTQTPKRGRIETIQTRRQRRESTDRTLRIEEEGPSSAALLSTSLVPAGNDKRVKLADFLRDSGEGTPMSTVSAETPKRATRQDQRTLILSPQKKQSIATAVVPQVRIVNGEIVVDDQISLSTPNPSEKGDQLTVVNESGRLLNSHSFVKSIGNNRWSRKDTDLFYEALSMCGTDFGMIALLFKGREREHVKGKYKVEERANPTRVAAALRNRKPFDRQWLERVRADSKE